MGRDGFRRLQDLQVEANATARLSAVDEYFSFDLDELILREKWEEGARTDQYSRIYGSGHFDFVASEDSPYIEMNGTIPLLHFQSEDGETVADSIIVDGTYDGDAQGTFGLVRKIVESGVFQNATGEYFEADKIQNESGSTSLLLHSVQSVKSGGRTQSHLRVRSATRGLDEQNNPIHICER